MAPATPATQRDPEDKASSDNSNKKADESPTTNDNNDAPPPLPNSAAAEPIKSQTSSAQSRWAILRRAIVKSNPNSSHSSSSSSSRNQPTTAAAEGSIHQFQGFNFLRRQRLTPGSPTVKVWTHWLTQITIDNNNSNSEEEEELVNALEASLLALSSLRPDQWIWEFSIARTTSQQGETEPSSIASAVLLDRLEGRLQQQLRLKREESGWIGTNGEDATTSSTTCRTTRILKLVLAPFFPTHGIFQYSLPSSFPKQEETGDAQIPSPDDVLLTTRERLTAAPSSTSLQELTSHHHHQGVDNTGNICVWDSEQTMAYCLLQHLALQNIPFLGPRERPGPAEDDLVDILELGSGMAGLAGLALAQMLQKQQKQHSFRLWLTDGHPQAVQNNRVHAYLMHLQYQQQQQQQQSTSSLSTTTTRPVPVSSSSNPIQCRVLKWSLEKPAATATASVANEHPPPCCHLALVSDCTHFQEFHAHLFLTLAYSVRVHGCVYLCQPHRGASLQRFLDVVRSATHCSSSSNNNNTKKKEESQSQSPLFSIEWLHVQELEDAATTAASLPHYDPNIHRPHWILLRKLREVTDTDRSLVLEHMKGRDK